jgi:hypothetical protein
MTKRTNTWTISASIYMHSMMFLRYMWTHVFSRVPELSCSMMCMECRGMVGEGPCSGGQEFFKRSIWRILQWVHNQRQAWRSLQLLWYLLVKFYFVYDVCYQNTSFNLFWNNGSRILLYLTCAFVLLNFTSTNEQRASARSQKKKSMQIQKHTC